jgi:carbon monoxide dehydrogenase subunit G
MELTQEFRVGISVPEAWKVLTDLERIAPMLPGAQLEEIDGNEYRGVVKVKVGPIVAQYRGQATFVERDEEAGRVVLRATGRDTRGQGNASATITANMQPDGDGTKVSVVTDLTITGKVAQFGRGVLAEVSAKLMGQFVDTLEADLAAVGADHGGSAETDPGSNGSGPEASTTPSTVGDGAAGTSGVRRIDSPESEPVDLVSVAGSSALKRMVPLIGVVILLVVLQARRKARRARRSRRTSGLVEAQLPSVTDITHSLPALSDITRNLPSVAELAGHLPGISVSD